MLYYITMYLINDIMLICYIMKSTKLYVKTGKHPLPEIDEQVGQIYPVPSYIRPVLCKYRIEVSFSILSG